MAKSSKNKRMLNQGSTSWQALRVVGDLVDGFDTLDGIENAVTFFGSARISDETHPYYVGTREMAKIVADKGFNVITGGGPGLMEAANRGAQDSKKDVISCGIGIELPFEAGNNDYVDYDYNVICRYFFVRKMMVMNFSNLYVGLPGGFGTIEEVFEVITLMQTGKLPKSKVVLFKKDFWDPLLKFVKDMIDKGMASKKDLDFIAIIDEPKDIIKYL